MVTADELVKKQKKKNKTKEKVFKKVYERIEKKIEMSSNNDYYQCMYEIPEFMIGIPLYNLKDCIKYVDKKLSKNGFKRRWSQNQVIINWETEDDSD